jgi:hypothetical protein
LAVAIKVVGQASRRGVIPRLPAPDKLLGDVRDWVSTEYEAYVRSARVVTSDAGVELHLDLHPAADPVVLTADAEGRVVATADSSAAGPGYHTFAGRVLDRIGDEMGITWSHEHAPRAVGTAAWVGSKQPIAPRADAEKDHVALLGHVVARAGEQRRRGVSGIQIGLAADARYQFDGPIATPLGPRDDAWLGRAERDAWAAADIRPWWFDATDARYLLQRALVLMWTEIRWRPAGDDAEKVAIDEALSLLRKALPSDASLAYPWREWAELITLRGIPDPISDRVFLQAERIDRTLPLIGYRRRPVTITHEGWVLQVPGSFGEQRTADEWRGEERGRQVTLAATETRTSNGMPMSADWFMSRVVGDLGEGVLRHEDGELVGRARVTSDASSGLEVAVLEGFSAVTGRGAAIRVAFASPDDWRWAVDLWRSLRPA